MSITHNKKAKLLVSLIMVPLLLFAGLRFAVQHNRDRALHQEVQQPRPNIARMKLLVAQGADVSARHGPYGGWTLLHSAIKHPMFEADVATVQFLLEAGADVNAKDPNGATPLMLAAMERSVPTVRLLLSHGADVNIKNGSLTALEYVYELTDRPSSESKRIVQLLKKARAKQ